MSMVPSNPMEICYIYFNLIHLIQAIQEDELYLSSIFTIQHNEEQYFKIHRYHSPHPNLLILHIQLPIYHVNYFFLQLSINYFKHPLFILGLPFFGRCILISSISPFNRSRLFFRVILLSTNQKPGFPKLSLFTPCQITQIFLL